MKQNSSREADIRSANKFPTIYGTQVLLSCSQVCHWSTLNKLNLFTYDSF